MTQNPSDSLESQSNTAESSQTQSSPSTNQLFKARKLALLEKYQVKTAELMEPLANGPSTGLEFTHACLMMAAHMLDGNMRKALVMMVSDLIDAELASDGILPE